MNSPNFSAEEPTSFTVELPADHATPGGQARAAACLARLVWKYQFNREVARLGLPPPVVEWSDEVPPDEPVVVDANPNLTNP